MKKNISIILILILIIPSLSDMQQIKDEDIKLKMLSSIYTILNKMDSSDIYVQKMLELYSDKKLSLDEKLNEMHSLANQIQRYNNNNINISHIKKRIEVLQNILERNTFFNTMKELSRNSSSNKNFNTDFLKIYSNTDENIEFNDSNINSLFRKSNKKIDNNILKQSIDIFIKSKENYILNNSDYSIDILKSGIYSNPDNNKIYDLNLTNNTLYYYSENNKSINLKDIINRLPLNIENITKMNTDEFFILPCNLNMITDSTAKWGGSISFSENSYYILSGDFYLTIFKPNDNSIRFKFIILPGYNLTSVKVSSTKDINLFTEKISEEKTLIDNINLDFTFKINNINSKNILTDFLQNEYFISGTIVKNFTNTAVNLHRLKSLIHIQKNIQNERGHENNKKTIITHNSNQIMLQKELKDIYNWDQIYKNNKLTFIRSTNQNNPANRLYSTYQKNNRSNQNVVSGTHIAFNKHDILTEAEYIVFSRQIYDSSLLFNEYGPMNNYFKNSLIQDEFEPLYSQFNFIKNFYMNYFITFDKKHFKSLFYNNLKKEEIYNVIINIFENDPSFDFPPGTENNTIKIPIYALGIKNIFEKNKWNKKYIDDVIRLIENIYNINKTKDPEEQISLFIKLCSNNFIHQIMPVFINNLNKYSMGSSSFDFNYSIKGSGLQTIKKTDTFNIPLSNIISDNKILLNDSISE